MQIARPIDCDISRDGAALIDNVHQPKETKKKIKQKILIAEMFRAFNQQLYIYGAVCQERKPI